MEIRNISEFEVNAEIKKFLEIEGAVDDNDGEIYGSAVKTRDTFEGFRETCASFSSVESKQFGNQEMKILRGFQFRKGDVRKSFFWINFGDDSQNLVIIF